MASVSWQYPQDQLIALRRQNAAARGRAAGRHRRRHLADCNFRYAIEGDTPPWRPLRAFDDGTKVYIEFPRGIAPGRDAAALHHRPGGRHPSSSTTASARTTTIVDRLFAAAELRLGDEQQRAARPHRPHRREAPV